MNILLKISIITSTIIDMISKKLILIITWIVYNTNSMNN